MKPRLSADLPAYDSLLRLRSELRRDRAGTKWRQGRGPISSGAGAWREGGHEEGNTLLVSLIAMLTIGLALVTFLTLAMNQNQLVVHTQVFNASLPTAEAGIQDSFNHFC